MFRHYLMSGLRQIRRTPGLAWLVVSIVGIGIGLSMAAWTSVFVLTRDPIPSKSDRIFHVQLDPRRIVDGKPSSHLPRLDAQTLLRDARGKHQAMMVGGSSMLQTADAKRKPMHATSRYATADFFPMFLVPFEHGRAWTAQEEQARAQVAVIDGSLSERLFGSRDSVGKDLIVDGKSFRIVGVTRDWRPLPRFYDLSGDHFRNRDQLFIPFDTALDKNLKMVGELSCWDEVAAADGPGDPRRSAGAPCLWVDYFVELDSPASASGYLEYLRDHARSQHALGRFQQADNAALRDVGEWLRWNNVVPSDVWIQSWVATGLLLLAVINAAGLILTIFMGRRHEIAVRRAVGASRARIFVQFMTEAGLLGVLGAGLGVAVAMLALWGLRQQPQAYAGLVRMNPTMLLATVIAALASMLAAGAFPSWRVMQVPPSVSLKQGG